MKLFLFFTALNPFEAFWAVIAVQAVSHWPRDCQPTLIYPPSVKRMYADMYEVSSWLNVSESPMTLDVTFLKMFIKIEYILLNELTYVYSILSIYDIGRSG